MKLLVTTCSVFTTRGQNRVRRSTTTTQEDVNIRVNILQLYLYEMFRWKTVHVLSTELESEHH